MSHEHEHVPVNPAEGHEHRDANALRLLMIGGGLLVLLLITLAAMWGLMRLFQTEAPPVTTQESDLVEHGKLPPQPRLQTNPAADLAAFRAKEDSVLRTYGWEDRAAGRVRVPIDSAMALIARNGNRRDLWR